METHSTIGASLHRHSKPTRKHSSSRRRILKHKRSWRHLPDTWPFCGSSRCLRTDSSLASRQRRRLQQSWLCVRQTRKSNGVDQCVEKRCPVEPNDAIAFNNLGATLYKAGRYQEALEAFNNAVRLAPNDADALNNLGAVFYVLEQYARALDSFQKAVAAKADSADAHYNLGNAYYMTGRHREATAAYRRAIQLNRDYVEARTNLGSLLISLGDLSGAIAELQESIRLRAGNPVAHNNLGYAYVKLGETLDRTAANQYLRQAVAAYQEALRLKPDYVKAQNNLGAAYNKLGQYQEAAEVLHARRVRSPIFLKRITTSVPRFITAGSSRKQ